MVLRQQIHMVALVMRQADLGSCEEHRGLMLCSVALGKWESTKLLVGLLSSYQTTRSSNHGMHLSKSGVLEQHN